MRCLAIAVLAIGAGVAGYLTRGQSPLQLPAPRPSAPSAGFVRGTVQSRSETSLVLSSDEGAVTVKLSAATAVEELRAATLASLQPDDWLNAGGVPHAQTVFALTALVVIPRSQLREGP